MAVPQVQGPNIFAAFNQGFDLGQKREARNALLAATQEHGPLSPQAMQHQTFLNPQFGAQVALRQADAERQQGQFDARMAQDQSQFDANMGFQRERFAHQKAEAAERRRQAAAALALRKTQMEYDRLDAAQKAQAAQVGAVLGTILNLPDEASRAQAWAKTREMYAAQGADVSQVPEQYPGYDAAAVMYSTLTREPWKGATAGKPTADMREYQLAREQGYKGSFMEYQTELERAGSTNVNVLGDEAPDPAAAARAQVDLAGQEAGAKKFGQTMVSIWDEGAQAREDLADIQRLRQSLRKSGSGTAVNMTAALGDMLGIQLSSDATQNARSLIAKGIPRMRIPGSGTSTDADMKNFERMWVQLINTPGANEAIMDGFEAIFKYRAARAQLAGKYGTTIMSRREMVEEFEKLDKEFSAEIRGAMDRAKTVYVTPESGQPVEGGTLFPGKPNPSKLPDGEILAHPETREPMFITKGGRWVPIEPE